MPSPRAKRPTRRKKTAFVPRSIFVSALSSVSVIPICACGGDISSGPQLGVAATAFDGGDGGRDARPLGVAVDTFGDSVAAVGFDGGDVTLGVADVSFRDAPLGVAVIGFDGSDSPLGVAADAFVHDAPLGVALPAFDGSNPPGQCVQTCMSDMECQATCPAVAGALQCCDTGASNVCYSSAATTCPH